MPPGSGFSGCALRGGVPGIARTGGSVVGVVPMPPCRDGRAWSQRGLISRARIGTRHRFVHQRTTPPLPAKEERGRGETSKMKDTPFRRRAPETGRDSALRMPRMAIEDAATQLRRALWRAHDAALAFGAVAAAMDPGGLTDASSIAAHSEDAIFHLAMEAETVNGLEALPHLLELPRRRRVRRGDFDQSAVA